MRHPLPQIDTGHPSWAIALRDYTDQFHREYWSNFTPCKAADIDACQRAINRTFPPDFRQFLLDIGSGHFPSRYGGGIYTLEEIILACPGPLWMILGSSEWAHDADHRRFYATRSQFNPAPAKFTPARLNQFGFNLLDLLQIGTDGACCYHQLYVGAPPAPFGYALLAPDATFDARLPTFTAFLSATLLSHRAESAEST